MKIALLNDVHFGCRNNSEKYHLNHIFRFFSEVFFPHLDKNPEIRDIWILGDFVENRKVINVQTARWIRDYFFKPCHERGIKLHALVGNHDCFYRETNEVNVYREFWADEFETIIENTPVTWNGIDIIPWINQNNLLDVTDFIEKSESKYAFGHLSIEGARMFKSTVCVNGMPASVFDKYEKVLTGHFHERSVYNNIIYLGNQYDTNWAEYCPKNEYKGFSVFDTDTGNITFVKNPNKCHTIIYYDDTDELPDGGDYDVGNKIVKVVVKSRKSNGYFQRFIDDLNKQDCISLLVVDDAIKSLLTNRSETDETTLKSEEALFSDYIMNDIETSLDRKKLLTKTMELYTMAKEIR